MFLFEKLLIKSKWSSTIIFWNQKLSLTTWSAFLKPCRYSSMSMMINFTSFVEIISLKLWLQARIELASFESFLWLFNLRLNAISAFPTYWMLHNMHSVRWILYSFLQLRLNKPLNVGFVYWLLYRFVFITWLQYRILAINKNDIYFPVLEEIFEVCNFSYVYLRLFFLDCCSSWRLCDWVLLE